MPEHLLIDRPEAAIARLTLHRPERKNALSTALRDDIAAALDGLADDPELKVVVLTGVGTAFCAGFDLAELERSLSDEAYAAELWASSDRYHQTVLQFPLPTIAAVNGPALGGGFDLAVLCDLRVAARSARFAHPEQAFADVVYGPLHDLVGGAVARDLCFTGRSVDAAEALLLHLVSEVVDDDALADRALDVAHSIARAPRASLRHTKAKALRAGTNDPARETLDL